METYIELGAMVAPNKFIRNIFIPFKKEPVDEWRDKYGNTDVYASVYRYDNKDIRSTKFHGPLPFDFDGEYAKEDLKAMLNFLTQHGLKEESVQVFYSGSKGFHVQIAFEALEIESSSDLNKVYEAIAKDIKTTIHASTLDTAIYDNVRLWRLSNSINSKSGLYKIPLTQEELNLSIEQIRELAKQSRLDFSYPKPVVWDSFKDVYKKAVKSIKKGDLKKGVFEPVGEGQRNDITFRRAIKLKSQGKTLDEAIEFCLKIQDEPPLPDSEIRRTVASAFQEKYVVEAFKVKGEKGNNEVTTSFLLTNSGIIIEEVYDPGLGEPLFAIYDHGSISYKASVQENGQIYTPIGDELVTKKIVKLPTQATEYLNEISLLTEVKDFIHAYVDIIDEWENWAAYYVLLSWVYDKLPVCPYLCALGASSTGKTRFVQTVGSICYKPITASGSITASPIFRALDEFRGTLIINEFDHIGEYKDEIIVILNNGFEAGLPVIRTEGDEKKMLKTFHVFGPKLFSARKRKNDWAFESRLLTIPMKETKRTDIPPFLDDQFHKRAQDLRNKLLMFRFKHLNRPTHIQNDMFTNIRGRLRQTLLAITSVIQDEKFLEIAKEFAKKQENSLKNLKVYDLDAVAFQILLEKWDSQEKIPSLKDVTKQVRNLTDLDKLTERTVAAVIRDEFGFEVKRYGKSGHTCIFLTPEIENIRERYETINDNPIPELSSAPSAASALSLPKAEDTEDAEANTTNSNGLDQSQFYKEGGLNVPEPSMDDLIP